MVSFDQSVRMNQTTRIGCAPNLNWRILEKTTLPLIGTVPASAHWHGWQAVGFPASDEAPEPRMPQGAYGATAPTATIAALALEVAARPRGPAELLAPAGGLEAG